MEKITTAVLREMKERKEKIVMLTAYDYPTAKMEDEAGIDAILVGDSLGNVILGYRDTLAVTMDEMVHHTKAVARGTKHALVIADMPFLSYQASTEDAIRNAGRLIKEGRAEAVKLEGGRSVIDKVEAIIGAGIPVMGHLGMTPQSIHQFGGYKVRGKNAADARSIIEDSEILEKAGVFSIVLECMPYQLARMITEKVDVPTIGIGAGPYCNGQVLVIHDLLGLSGEFSPKFVKKYAKLGGVIMKALADFKGEVKSGKFPSSEHCYEMKGDELKKLIKHTKSGK
jgi:3-methyl-2-oxobutanoate hydroxymethyltransferase